MDSAHLGKMTKRITAKKLSLRKVRIRSLEGRKIGGQPSKDTLEWKVNKKLLGKQHQKKKKKKKIWEIRKKQVIRVAGTTWALVPRGAEEENQWYLKTPEWRYKREKQPTLKGHSEIVNHNRIIKKTLSKLKESSKRKRNIVRYPKTTTIEHTWIQKNSNFTSFRGLDSHLSL